MFGGFVRRRIDVDGTAINLLQGGRGAPVLLLHGYPQTHACWHRLAPVLAKHFAVVCPDLRGYGDSDKPPGDAEHRAYAKRTLAREQVAVMRALGFERFAVVGHDRGGRVAHRMALDHAERVSRLALLDIVPTRTVYDIVDREHATEVWRWFFLTQPFDLPERLIGGDPDFYLRWTLDDWCGTPGTLTDEAVAEYRRCFDAATIHASCEDYRAGATADLADDADAARKIACPLLLLWSRDGIGAAYDVAGAWRERARGTVQGHALDCGHFLAEERPDEVAAALTAFLAQEGPRT
jgi:haloacetate dehalogenase